MFAGNPVPRSGQRAIEIVVDGRSIVSCGHRAKTLPELRGVGLLPIEPANVIRGRREDVRGQRTTGANSALRPFGKFTLKGIRALRTRPFDADQKGLGPMTMVHQNLGRHVGL